MTEEEITVKIKMTINTQIHMVTIKKSSTVKQLKEEVAKLVNIPADSQNMVFSGRVLADDNTLEASNVKNESVIILVRKKTLAAASKPPESSAASTSSAPEKASIPPKEIKIPEGEEISFKVKMTSSGQIHDMKVSKNATVLMVKQLLESKVNIEAQYQTLVFKGKILQDALTLDSYKIENDNTIILVKKASAPKTEPSSGNQQSNFGQNQPAGDNTNSNQNANANPFANLANMMGGLGGLGGMGGMPGMGMPGMGMPGMGGMPNFQQMAQLLQNPMYMNMMSSMLQDPAAMQMILNNPQIRALADANPQLREVLNNPEMMRQMFSPEAMQQMSQMLAGMGAMSGAGAGNTGSNPMGGMPAFNPFMGMGMNPFAGMGGMPNTGAGTGAGAGASANSGLSDEQLKEKYKDQLQQLKDMGFVDEETNLQVLKQCDGNVQFAVERLLNMMG